MHNKQYVLCFFFWYDVEMNSIFSRSVNDGVYLIPHIYIYIYLESVIIRKQSCERVNKMNESKEGKALFELL